MLGSCKGKRPEPEALAAFIDNIPVLDFDLKAAETYTRLPLRRRSFDRLIAAHALSRDLTVVTDNISDFADIPRLKIENWTLPL